ncbi:hypothetical protein AB0I84_13585 [Streptomyces spectabilis]|uniref:hypothetical protein n=1 Tax=Streptomyces spectabilis TaxID=68270 RepID=UPI0033E241CB
MSTPRYALPAAAIAGLLTLAAAAPATADSGWGVSAKNTAAASAAAQADTDVTSAAAPRWYCSGRKVSRCITRAGRDRVQLNFVNKTYKKVKTEFGVTYQGRQGQDMIHLTYNLRPRGGCLSRVIKCPAGFRESAVGWQITPGHNVYHSPNITI